MFYVFELTVWPRARQKKNGTPWEGCNAYCRLLSGRIITGKCCYHALSENRLQLVYYASARHIVWAIIKAAIIVPSV